MKKLIIIAAAAASLALPVAASAMPGQQPGSNASYCGAGHGTFGYLGEHGERHDLGQGDNSPTGMLKLGATGPATGAANSVLCGNG